MKKKVINDRYKIDNYKVIGKSFYEKRLIDDALKFYEKAYKSPLGKNDTELILDIALIYDEKEEYVKAAEKYKEILKIDKKDERAYYGLAIIYDNKQNYNEAINYYKKAIEINPKYNRAFFFLAGAYDAIGQKQKAIKCYNEVLKMDSDDFWANLNLGSYMKN
ncbi:conserved protein, tetratricopeptide repeat family protein [Clostridium botulinum C str. Eklund]|nr:conserved protein, tetratricopeptide repeat family protein [Clostridium botulinum C str. Eklund]